MKIVWQSLRMLAVLSVLTGVVYPLAMTAIAQLFMPDKANGSLIERNGRVIGSALVGQSFSSERYFWPRPSAVGYNPLPSGGANLGPTSRALRDSVTARAQRFGATLDSVPADLLTASGSGLDPHISPTAALFQVDRVAKARSLDGAKRAELIAVVQRRTEAPQWGIFGEPRVNVLQLNLALDSLFE